MATSPPKKPADLSIFASDIIQRLKDHKPLLKMPTLAKGRAIGIPLRYQGRPPDQVFKNAESLFSDSMDYVSGITPGWPGHVLYGALGRGKTGACCEILKMFEMQGYHGLFTLLYDMVAEIKETWNESSSEIVERQALERFIKPALLVVDEVGVQFSTVAERNLLYKVVVSRYNGNLPTLLTTNIMLNTSQGMSDFNKSAGDRVCSRFDGYRTDCSDWGDSLRGK